MHTAEVDGTALAYEERGHGEPVVLIHGGILADVYAPLLADAALVGRYRLVAYHRRGYGRSARATPPAGIERQAGDCLDLLRHPGIEGAHLVGYSISGAIALQLARDAPSAVRSLAPIEPTIPAALTDPTVAVFFLGTLRAAFSRYGAGDKAGAVDTWARGAFGSAYRTSLDQALPGAFAQATADADVLFLIDAPALQQWSFGTADAARITQPVLSVYHEDRVWAGFRHAHELLRAWLPHLETCVFAGVSHLLPVTHPRAVADTLASFFALHPPPGPSWAASTSR